MKQQTALDLDFDKVLQLVAAHARSSVGRSAVLSSLSLPTAAAAAEQARLSLELEQLLAEKGRLPLTGIDDALPWLEPGAASPREISDLLHLLTLAKCVATVRRRLAAAPGELMLLHSLGERLPDTAGLVSWAGSRLGHDGHIPDQASPELARLRAQQVRLRQQLVRELEDVKRRHGGAVADAPPTLRRDRYCLPVRTSARGTISGLVLDSSGSGATVFLEPYSVVELNNALVEAVSREHEEVRRIIDEVVAAFAAVQEDLVSAVAVLAALDAAQAKVLLGKSLAGRIVIPRGDGELILCRARHPLLDERLAGLRQQVLDDRRSERRSVPLDLRLPEGVGTLIVSGPNAGGKTVVLKSIGVMVLMAYHGIPLPVDAGTTIPALDDLWCHIGDEQSVADELSTFSGAMASTAELLARAGPRTMVLYDELGAGTDPLEGAALGLSLLEELTRLRCSVVATTHLASIALSADSTAGMGNAAMEYDEAAGRPTYRLRMGRPGRSRALEIAAAMGVSEAILERSRELLGGAHLELDTWLRRLEQVEAELLDERARLHRRQQECERQSSDLEAERQRLLTTQERLTKQLYEERERLRRRAKEQLDRALEELTQATKDLKPLGRKRQQQLRDRAMNLPLELQEKPEQDGPQLEPGMQVRSAGLGDGTLQEIRGSRCLVSLAGKRLWLDLAELEPLPRSRQPQAGGRRRPAVALEAEEEIPAELMLLGLDAETARAELEAFLDRAFTAGRSFVRVVHGHGTGALRRMVGELCRSHPAVRSYRHPPQHLGGTGATEVELESSG